MGRGSSKVDGGYGGKDWGSGSSDANPNDIKNIKDMISQRGSKTTEVDNVLSVARSMNEQFGDDGIIYQFGTADMVKSARTAMAVYDGSNIIVNNRYMDSKKMNKAYDNSVKTGFHPSRGKKSGIEAVAAHEYGHALTDKAAKKMGVSMDKAASTIMNEARSKSRTKGFAAHISRYATTNAHEAISEAFSDVYCNGSKASNASKLVVNTLKKYLKSK